MPTPVQLRNRREVRPHELRPIHLDPAAFISCSTKLSVPLLKITTFTGRFSCRSAGDLSIFETACRDQRLQIGRGRYQSS